MNRTRETREVVRTVLEAEGATDAAFGFTRSSNHQTVDFTYHGRRVHFQFAKSSSDHMFREVTRTALRLKLRRIRGEVPCSMAR